MSIASRTTNDLKHTSAGPWSALCPQSSLHCAGRQQPDGRKHAAQPTAWVGRRCRRSSFCFDNRARTIFSAINPGFVVFSNRAKDPAPKKLKRDGDQTLPKSLHPRALPAGRGGGLLDALGEVGCADLFKTDRRPGHRDDLPVTHSIRLHFRGADGRHPGRLRRTQSVVPGPAVAGRRVYSDFLTRTDQTRSSNNGPHATNVATPLRGSACAARRGVCQEFRHPGDRPACLAGIGAPLREQGYLLNQSPPPGQSRAVWGGRGRIGTAGFFSVFATGGFRLDRHRSHNNKIPGDSQHPGLAWGAGDLTNESRTIQFKGAVILGRRAKQHTGGGECRLWAVTKGLYEFAD